MTSLAKFARAAGALITVASASAQVSPVAQRAALEQFNADIQRSSSSLLSPADKAVKLSGQLQFRYTINQRDDDSLDEDTTIGFHVRRAKLKIGGDVGDHWSYKISTDFSRKDGSASVSTAYIRYDLGDGANLTIGQFKLPFTRENLVSSSKQLAADRSVASSFFSEGRTQGVQFSRTGETTRIAFALSDGANTKNTDFDSSKEADVALTARAEYRFAGDKWSAFKQFTSTRGSPFAAMLGGAVHYQTGGETFATKDEDKTSLTADISLLGDGWNAFVSTHWTQTDPASGSDDENSGFVAQGGYYINPTWEVFARYDTIFSDQVDDFSTVTLGVNHYLIPESHAAKLTADIQYFLDEQGTSDADDSTGTSLLESDQDSQWAIRVQLQLLF